jgi:hypothetical protein
MPRVFEQGIDELADLLVLGEVIYDYAGLVEHPIVFEGINYLDQQW